MVAATLRSYRTPALIAISSIVVLGALFTLALSAQNSAQFGRLQPWILLVSVFGVVALSVMLARKVLQLVRAFRDHVPGSRLTARTVTVFGILVAIPLLTVYLFSLEFLNRGIDSWFRVEIRQGLNDALVLSRAALDLRMREYSERTERFAQRIAEAPVSCRSSGVSGTEPSQWRKSTSARGPSGNGRATNFLAERDLNCRSWLVAI